VGRLLGGREAGLRMECRDRESEGKRSNQLLCRQNEGECIWDGKRFRKVVEVNRDPRQALWSRSMMSVLVFFRPNKAKST
jgi:hypothetical protein